MSPSCAAEQTSGAAVDGGVFGTGGSAGGVVNAGNKLEFLQATVDLALEHPDLGAPFRRYLEALFTRVPS